jgi:hypothetical protein
MEHIVTVLKYLNFQWGCIFEPALFTDWNHFWVEQLFVLLSLVAIILFYKKVRIGKSGIAEVRGTSVIYLQFFTQYILWKLK